MLRFAAVVCALVASGAAALAGARPPASPVREPPRPFRVGEKLVYDVKFGPIHVGGGDMTVVGIDEVRGIAAFHTRFTIHGGIPLYHVDDVYESWFDTLTFDSYRYHQSIHEGRYKRNRLFEISPELGTFTYNGGAPFPTSPDPLDDGAFLYFIRTVPLEVGQSYEFARYFQPIGNPVVIRVLRHERISVPAGTFETTVVQPVIKTSGIFSEHGRAEVWLSDDSTRAIVQLKAHLSFGSLNMYLRSIGSAGGAKP